MNWRESLLEELSRHAIIGYHASQSAATEPTAFAALALIGSGRNSAARDAVDWLSACQGANGSIGVRFEEPEPRWPTSLAVLTWLAARDSGEKDPKAPPYDLCIQRAVQWIQSAYGKPIPRDPDMGHDPTIAAWAWVEGTHSWIEPTSFHVIALKAAGYWNHERTRVGVRCLIDRQLPSGGCNYGNTLVLGQELRPHVQPSGLALLALAGETDVDGRIAKSLDYLQRSTSSDLTTASLCFALLALAAHDRWPDDAEKWLASSYERVIRAGKPPYKLALLGLTMLGKESPLVNLPRKTKT